MRECPNPHCKVNLNSDYFIVILDSEDLALKMLFMDVDDLRIKESCSLCGAPITLIAAEKL